MFFWIASLVCVALVPAMPAQFRWVAWATAGLGSFWSILLTLEDLTRPRELPEVRFPQVEPEPPFSPPPPPGGTRE